MSVVRIRQSAYIKLEEDDYIMFYLIYKYLFDI